MSDDTPPVDIIHKACGRVAFRYDHVPQKYEAITAAHATLLDGSVPIAGSETRCGTCGELIGRMSALTVIEPGPA